MELLPFLYQKLLFTPADIEQELGNMRSAKTLLLRYQHKGYVSKVRRGLYCVNNLATGLPEANKYQVASAVTPTSFVAYHAAMEYHGLAHQVYYNVAVGGSMAFNSFDFDNNHFAHYNLSDKYGIDLPVADSHVRVTNVERTIVECVDRIDLCGGWEELVSCLRSVRYLREELLLSTLYHYDKITLYKKVGFLSEQLGMPVSRNFITKCWRYAKDSVTFLTSDGGSDTFSASWRMYAPHNLLTLNEQNGNELV